MSGGQFLFYATASDLGPLLSSLEAQKKLQYTLAGMFEANRPRTYRSYADIPRFGQPHHPSSVANPYWLISPETTAIRVEAVPQRAGGTLFAISQKFNEDTLTFRPGGRYEGDVLLYGEVSTISDQSCRRIYTISLPSCFAIASRMSTSFLSGRRLLSFAKPAFDLRSRSLRLRSMI